VNLRDQMTRDLTRTFLRPTDFAEAGTFLPRGAGPGFACIVVRDDAPAAPASGEVTQGQSETVRLLGILSALRAGILAQELAARDPAEGDQITLGTQTVTLQTITLEGGGSDAVALTGTIAGITTFTTGRKDG
jgi:hypothetical protein